MLLLEKRQGWEFTFRRQMLHEAKPHHSATEEIGEQVFVCLFFLFFFICLLVSNPEILTVTSTLALGFK